MFETSHDTRQIRARAVRAAAHLEWLEARQLLSAVTGYALPGVTPLGIAHDNNGNLWIADQAGLIDEATVDAGGNPTLVAQFSSGNATVPEYIAFNPVNQHLYVDSIGDAGDGNSYIVEMDTGGNIINQFAVPGGSSALPVTLSVAPDGSIWFADAGETQVPGGFECNIVRMDMNGNFTEQLVPTLNATPVVTAAAPDGSVWFTIEGITGESDSALGHATFGNNAISVTTYTLPTPAGLMNSITVAPNGSLWYTEDADVNVPDTTIQDTLGQVTVNPDNSLSFTEYLVPKASGEGATAPGSVQVDSTGKVWFNESGNPNTGVGGRLSYFDPSTGAFTRMPTPDFPDGHAVQVDITSEGVWETTFGADNGIVLNHVHFPDFSPPIGAAASDISGFAGQQFSGAVAVFASGSPGGFSYTIDYGNGDTQSGTLANDPSGVYTINGTETYAAAGNYNITVTVADSAGDVTTAVSSASIIANIPLVAQGVNLQGVEQTALAPNVVGVSTPVVAQFSGPVASYSAIIHWGDNTTTAGLIVSTGNNQYYVTLPPNTSKTYALQGTYNVSVVITDGTNSVTAHSQAIIADIPLLVSQNLVLQPIAGRVVVATVATFTDDPNSTPNWFKATINWGDNSTSKGVIVRTSAGHYVVLGLHLYKRAGNYAVDTLVVNQVEGQSATGTASVTIK